MLDATMLFYEKDRLPQPVIREKENRLEAADHGRSKTRNQHGIDFLRSTGHPVPRASVLLDGDPVVSKNTNEL